MTRNQVLEIERIVLRKLEMQLKNPFTTSFGTFNDKEFFVVEVVDKDGEIGYGESVAFSSPWYNEETVLTNLHVMEDFLIPLIFEKSIEHPDEVNERFSHIRRNNMAKAALEGAVWDLYSKRKGIPLSKALGGEKKQIEVGISIGIQKTTEELIEIIQKHVNEGYKRIKIKIKPGWDIDVIKEVRRKFPDIALMADANSAYTLEDIEHLKKLDQFDLMMIEQPLEHDDIVDHAKLQAAIKTPICLDESIHSLADARKAVELGSCRIINIKIGRVGGLTESKKIHDYCMSKGIPVWCGGMLEAGIGRAHNVAITSLANFVLPGDTASSSRYWEEDIIKPWVEVEDGFITIPEKAGIGFEINREVLDKFTVFSKTYKK